jgi:acetate kinase
MSHVLTLNAGSSSLKFALFSDPDLSCKAIGQIEGLGADPKLSLKDGSGTKLVSDGALTVSDHASALSRIIAEITKRLPEAKIAKVGHRVVHGGTTFTSAVQIDEAVLTQLEVFSSLAPLHQPHNLAGIRAAMLKFPGVPQVACFDTAFHRAHPFVDDTFALSRELYDEGVRRYGFHGLSYEYVADQLADIAPHHARGRVVICHLGSGASMCGLRHGQSVASTMGFTALDGLPMGTRPGQLDPGVVLYLLQEKGMTADEVSDLLYKKSGLKGLSGVSNDMRDLESSDSPHAKQAIDYFVFRVRREIGAMAAVLEGLDAIVFCGGIGRIPA